MAFTLTSQAFANGTEIARRHTCDGANLSPVLNWTGLPLGTHSLALIVDDPDAPAGTWTHWLVWNISPKTTGLPEGVPRAATLENGARQGTNDFRRIGYGGPCPPPGKPHRYFFRLFALDAAIELNAGAGRSSLEAAMNQHVLSESELMGTYKR